MAQMTPRERVVAAINHREPDRVPVDVGGGASTTVATEGYQALRRHLGYAEEPHVYEISKLFRAARMDEAVLRHLGVDCRPVHGRPPLNWRPPASEPGTYVDIWGVTWRQAYYAEGCYYWELYRSPLAEATIDDLEDYPWPDSTDPGFTAGLAEETKSLYENTDFALVGDGGWKSFWEVAYPLCGLERLLMDTVANPGFVSALLERILEVNLKGTGRFLDAVGRYIQVFRSADDMATQLAPMLSPKTYRAVIKPVYKRYLDFVKSKTDAKIFYHSCGNVANLIPEFVDVGIEILNPVQVAALEDVAGMKQRFGRQMAFWGGIDTQHVMPHGTVDDVEDEVKLRIRQLAPGGGFVLAAVHNIQPDVPPANIVAMVEAAHRYGRYPIEHAAIDA